MWQKEYLKMDGSKCKENHTYTHTNNTAKNQDKEENLKAVRKKKINCPVLSTEQGFEKHMLNERMTVWVSVR